MKTDEKRIKIAQACGWKLVTNDPDYQPYWLSPNGNRVGTDCGVRIPNYFNDLNAMNKAEKILFGNDKWMERYGREIHMRAYLHDMPNFHLQADERAEAFGKTLNLW